MVDLKIAINELNTGKLEFKANESDAVCTTEGEIVILLKRLQEFEALGFEPDELEDILQRK